MKTYKILSILVLLFLITASGCITQKEAPVETLAPVITAVPTTASPTTTPAPTTAPTTASPTTTPAPTTTSPTTTPAPMTTAPPTTTPAPTTAPPPTPTIDVLNQEETYGPGGELYVSGEVRNNWDKDIFDVQVSGTFYNQYGNVIVTLKSSPIDKMTPGATESFIIRTEYPKTTIDHYLLEAVSPTITTTTTPPPTTAAPPIGLEIVSETTEITTGGKLLIKGEIKNNGNEDLFTVQVYAKFYDTYGEKIDEKRSKPITKLSPGQTDSFSIESNVLNSNIVNYILEATDQLIS